VEADQLFPQQFRGHIKYIPAKELPLQPFTHSWKIVCA
jgi:hypothetical protein